MWPDRPRATPARSAPLPVPLLTTAHHVLAVVDGSDAGMRAATHAGRLAAGEGSPLTVVLVVPALVMAATFVPELVTAGFHDDYVLDALGELVPLLDRSGVVWSLRTVRSVSVSVPVIGELANWPGVTTVVVPRRGRPWHVTRWRMTRTARRLAGRCGRRVALVVAD
jgi:nucleotide-binding universal stress UspA family protein